MKGSATLKMEGRARSIVRAAPFANYAKDGAPLKVMRFAALVRTQMH